MANIENITQHQVCTNLVLYGVLLVWVLFLSREQINQTEILPCHRLGRERGPLLERIRQRWG